MGYANYWYQYRDFTDGEWVEIVDYFNTLMQKEEYRKLVDLGAVVHYRPIQAIKYEDQEIYFDGGEGGSCETFVLHKHEPKPRYEGDKTYFNFCKTRGLPYDKVVWKLLKFIKLIVLDPTKADFIISNDNGDEIVSLHCPSRYEVSKSSYDIAKSKAINTKHLVEEKE